MLSFCGFHIILNGPPSSGKDTLGAMLVDRTGIRAVEFKERLVAACCSLMGVSVNQWGIWYQEDKDLPRSELGGLSCRKVQQELAEKAVKPVFGSTFFADAAIKSAGLASVGVVYLDGGFDEEIIAVKKAVPSDRILLVRLFREGCTYQGSGPSDSDTRYYLDPAKHNLTHLDIECVEGDIVATFEKLLSELDLIIGVMKSERFEELASGN